jgi:hypothetical protein
MIGATLYIVWCSTKNRLHRRLLRLREPRYALGALVGSAYLYFTVYARARRAGSRNGFPLEGSPGARLLTLLPTLGAASLLIFAAIGVLLPAGTGLLELSKAETEFLLPLPVSRRQLLVYKLVRSLSGIVIGIGVFSILFPSRSFGGRLGTFLGGLVLLLTIRVFGAALALTQFRVRTTTGAAQRLARLPLVLILVAALIVLQPALQLLLTMRPFDPREAITQVAQAWAGGVRSWILLPFLWLIQPVFVTSPVQLLTRLPLALLVLAGTFAWVLALHQAFADMSDGVSERRVTEPQAQRTRYRTGQAVWTLPLTGRAETALAWKNAQQMLRVVNRRVWIRAIVLIGWFVIMVSTLSRARGLSAALAIITAMFGALSVFLGPQIYRADIRQDLERIDVLKTWPIRPGAVIRGEMLWPAGVVTLVAWGFTLMAMLLSAPIFARLGASWRVPGGLAIMLMTPALIVAQYTVHATLALLFPAWIPSGRSMPRGIDAMGQRMIMLLGTLITLVVALLPAAIAGAVLWFAFYRWVGAWVLPAAAVVGAVLTGLEALAATEALAPLYERLDIAAVERSE